MFCKQFSLLACLCFLFTAATAQDRYFTKTGKIQFESKAALEDIEAKNNSVLAAIDTKTGAVQFSAQMKSFEFEKALMQQHFNDNYVESDKYPKAEFKGTLANNSAVNYTRDGTYPVRVKGKLTLHNITRDVEVPGTIRVNGDKVEAAATFNLLLSDYNISIPSPVKNKISNSIKIVVDAKLEAVKP